VTVAVAVAPVARGVSIAKTLADSTVAVNAPSLNALKKSFWNAHAHTHVLGLALALLNAFQIQFPT